VLGYTVRLETSNPKEASMPVAEIARQMLDTYPRDYNVEEQLLVSCIEACYDCSQACTQCADDSLSEQDVQGFVKCIRLCLDCSDVCATTGNVVSRQTEYDANVTRAVLQACIATCRSSGDECQHHADHGVKHCQVCADQCRRCEQACKDLLAAIG
jgi:hypothetical protein